MGVVSVDLIGRAKRRATWSSNYNLALEEPEREFVAPYQVVTDGFTVNPQEVLEGAWGAGLPLQWEQHATDPYAVAAEFAVEEADAPDRWLVHVTYKLITDPTAEPGIWSVSTGQTEWAVQQDITVPPQALVNTAGDPFDPPITVPNGHLILTCRQNLASVDTDDLTENYLFHTNAAEFRGHEAGKVWMADFQAQREFRNGVRYWACTFTFHARKRGWNAKPLNAGYRQLVNGQRLTIRDPGGQPVSTPALLAADGARLANGGTPVFLDFEVYESAEFGNLGLTGI